MHATHPHRHIPWPGLQACWAALAGIALVGLLLAFMQVVRAAVVQGDSQRRVVARDADAAWRCNALAGNRNREACSAQLKAAQAVR